MWEKIQEKLVISGIKIPEIIDGHSQAGSADAGLLVKNDIRSLFIVTKVDASNDGSLLVQLSEIYNQSNYFCVCGLSTSGTFCAFGQHP